MEVASIDAFFSRFSSFPLSLPFPVGLAGQVARQALQARLPLVDQAVEHGAEVDDGKGSCEGGGVPRGVDDDGRHWIAWRRHRSMKTLFPC